MIQNKKPVTQFLRKALPESPSLIIDLIQIFSEDIPQQQTPLFDSKYTIPFILNIYLLFTFLLA